MELAKAYDPKLVEDRLYASWMAAGRFRGVQGEGTPYCITIPPPNITGSLHMGHALNNSVIDTLVRWRRMSGDAVLCLPGTDHAGIATQNVVERTLASEGLSRHDLGREAFIERCWSWRKEYGDRIYLQFMKMGCSYDWDRARFTMDESYVDAIYECFIQWWDRGLVYRGKRVVNWCVRCRSAISDIEVNSEERPGKLYHLRYPYADGAGYVVVATTRPETMLGDTAVAVNPADERYSDRIGSLIQLPLTDRQIPLIADEHARADFGSGAVKITPAHDLDDYDVGARHRMTGIVVIGEDGAMTAAAGPAYEGLDRFACRDKVLADLEAQDLLDHIQDYTVQMPRCDRCKTELEPLLSDQWFVKQGELAQPAIDAVKDGRIKFYPERMSKIYLDWMEKIRDWCISRQLWWGHRIPVWWAEDGRCAPGRSVEDAAQRLGLEPSELRQDEDVLDTWFSSALWPQATLGWPCDSADLDFWYPTNLLSTAQEILYLWVARMIMTGLDFQGAIPFHDVYIHATVLDEKGDRMSKSKGNGVDPLEMIEKYGADALRFSLLQQAGMNQDIKYNEDRVRVAGAFCNKLWNASRFVLGLLGEANGAVTTIDPGCADGLATPDRWILSRLGHTAESVNASLATYDMDDAMRALYSFFWDEFCDWYVEIAKLRLRDEAATDHAEVRGVLLYTLDSIIRLLHPMVPFITEELWSALADLRAGGGETIMTAPYPTAAAGKADEPAETEMALVMECVRAIRNLRADLGVQAGLKVSGAILPSRAAGAGRLEAHRVSIMGLARLKDLSLGSGYAAAGGTWASSAIEGGEVLVEVGGALDVPKELQRLEKDMAAATADRDRCLAKLGNESFIGRAPADIVEKERAHVASLDAKLQQLEARRRLLLGDRA